MNQAPQSRLKRLSGSGSEGMAAAEFAIILGVFLMILLGTIEFGYDWYLRHLLTNASRDGARYGSMYIANNATGERILPQNLNPSIEQTVRNKLNGVLPSDIVSTLQVQCSGPGWTKAKPDPGDPLIVSVTITKNLVALGAVIPNFNPMIINVQTTMNVE